MFVRAGAAHAEYPWP